jgi:hypothetical protein
MVGDGGRNIWNCLERGALCASRQEAAHQIELPGAEISWWTGKKLVDQELMDLLTMKASAVRLRSKSSSANLGGNSYMTGSRQVWQSGWQYPRDCIKGP